MTKREEVLLERIESMIKQSKVRLDSWEKSNTEAITFEKGYQNSLSSLKFDIKYNH